MAQAVKLGEFSESTVILLHEGKNNIRLSVPNISLRGDTVESKSSDGPLFVVRGFTSILMVGHHMVKNLVNVCTMKVSIHIQA